MIRKRAEELYNSILEGLISNERERPVDLWITIPERHLRYVQALFETGILKGESDLAELFGDGFRDVMEDLRMGAGEFPPDMSRKLLYGKQTRIEIPYELNTQQNGEVEAIRKAFKFRRDTILRAFFLWALFDQWLILKDTKRYNQDSSFRRMIDSMPHDHFFESEEEEDLSFEDDLLG